MNCPNCGNDWWIEEKAVRLAAMPSQDARLMSAAREIKYQLRCANPNCNFIYGEMPKDEKENGNQKQSAGTTGKRTGATRNDGGANPKQ